MSGDHTIQLLDNHQSVCFLLTPYSHSTAFLPLLHYFNAHLLCVVLGLITELQLKKEVMLLQSTEHAGKAAG